MPPFADAITRWTIRLAMGLYFASAAAQLRAGKSDRRRQTARWLWTAGCGLYVLHVLAAFAYFYRWSHAVAWEQTARQTVELTGLNWGGGIWVNYAFTALWLTDAAWWWLAGVDNYTTRPRWQTATLHAIFIFMIVNGTIIFGTGGVRWFAAAGLAALAICLVTKK